MNKADGKEKECEKENKQCLLSALRWHSGDNLTHANWERIWKDVHMNVNVVAQES